jgi:arylsulfatase A-like enzyme
MPSSPANARKRLLIGGAVAAAVAIALGAYLISRSHQKRHEAGPSGPVKRVVLVVIDTLRADALGCYGYGRPTTPSIDALAQEGVRFDRFYAASSWTLPSFASILTGVSPSVHGAGSVLPDAMMTSTRMKKDIETLPEKLKRVYTAAIVNNSFLSLGYGIGRGFQRFDAERSSFTNNRTATATTDAAIALLEKHGDEPMFLMVHYFEPHTPYLPPAAFEARFTMGERGTMDPASRDQFDLLHRSVLVPKPAEQKFMRGLYDGEVAYSDAELGRLVDWMRKSGALDDTWLIVTSDHGEEHWEHGEFEHGHRFENEVSRVPLVIRAPGGAWHAGERVATSARHIDLTPTILELFGQEKDASLEGESLLPRVGAKGQPDRPCYMEFHRRRGREQKALFDGRYKIITARDGSSGYFYDLSSDPAERHPMTEADPRYASLKAAMDGYTAKRMHGAGATPQKGEAPDMSPALIQSLQSLGYIEDGKKKGAPATTSP